MYGGSSKLGRGGVAGRGSSGNKRLSYPPPPLRSSGQSSGRLSLGASSGASRNRAPGQVATASDPPAMEESFSLVPGRNPLAFAMIIRLTPDMVEEIRRVEAQDGTARIKFDANRNNPSENVIDVAGKTFRFTWSPEVGDLCDIYEERQSEDGNGLLVESGSAWRKLNVQRILDESTTNHVKRRSEEAERKHKSRKAIILDHGNPSVTSQIKTLAAVEANPRMMHYKQKKEPAFKKQKVESSQVGAPPRFIHKSGLTLASSAKARGSASPVPFPSEKSGIPASPSGTANTTKNNVNYVEVIPTQIISKENAVNSEKEISAWISGAVRERPVRKANFGSKPTDLQSVLINLLMENPKGMSLKALEKAIGDSNPNSIKKIEPIIKRIATFQAPGRYVLRPEVELESLKKPRSEIGSSPEDSNQQTLPPGVNHDQTSGPVSRFEKEVPNDSSEKVAPLNSKIRNELNASKRIDIKQHSPDLLGETKGSNISGKQIESSGASGSDSDGESNSSDSGSDSGSHSKSRSPVRSGSASSSDSETDGSSNSKEGSDEDVDIMSDDEKEPKQILQTSERGVSGSPLPWKTPEDMAVQGKFAGKQDASESDAVEIDKNLCGDEKETEIDIVSISVPNTQDEKPVEETNILVVNGEGHKNYAEDLFGDEVKESTKSRKKSYLNPENANRRKSERGNAQMRSPHESPDKGASQMANRGSRGEHAGVGLRKRQNLRFPGKFDSDFVLPDMRSSEQSTYSKFPDMAEREKADELPQNLGWGHKHPEKTSNVHEGPSRQKDKVYRYSEDEFGSFNEKITPVDSTEGGGGKHTVPSVSQYWQHGEMVGKFKEYRQVSGSQIGSPSKDNNRSGMDTSASVNGRGRILQRELSELELGELREPLSEEPLVKNKFERKSSFKLSDGKVSTSDNQNLDVSRRKPVGKETLVPGKPSPPNVSATVPISIEGSNKKRTLEHHIREDQADLGSQFNKLEEFNSKSRYNEDGAIQGIGLEGFGESLRKVSSGALQQHDIKQGPTSHPYKEGKRKTSTTVVELADVQKGAALAECNNNGRKKRDSSSDENSCSYSKYEKDKPEIRGQIKDFSKYEEYVQEYRDKYDSYCSLHKILEGYRNQFRKLKKDLESAKGRDIDRYYDVLNHLKESFRRCRPEHQRLAKIFGVLHEELQHLKQRIKDFAVSYSTD